jgi:hypothetical protein
MKIALKFAVAVVLTFVVIIGGWLALKPVLFKQQHGGRGIDDSALRTTDTPQTNATGAVVKTTGQTGVSQAKDVLSTQGMEVIEINDEGGDDDGNEDDDELTSAERAVKEWDDLAESLMEADFGADPNLSKKIKKAFDALETEEDQLDGMQAMMNLISDGAVQALVPILLDTSYSEDILDIIFSDILNRDDEIKYPILEEVAKDVNHPNFVDAAHILEVTKHTV